MINLFVSFEDYSEIYQSKNKEKIDEEDIRVVYGIFEDIYMTAKQCGLPPDKIRKYLEKNNLLIKGKRKGPFNPVKKEEYE